MTVKTAEYSWTSTSRETGKGTAVLMRLVGMVNAVRRHAEAKRRLHDLSPEQLRDIGFDPSEINPSFGRTVDPATMANLMSLR